MSLPLVAVLLAALCGVADEGFTSAADRQHLAAVLLRAGVLEKGRVLVHLSHTCNLRIGGDVYPVVDVRELVPGASFAHGLNQIVILDRRLNVEQSFEYVDHRPLFCSGNELYVFGQLEVNQMDPGGNVLIFADPKKPPACKTVDFNKLRSVPIQ